MAVTQTLLAGEKKKKKKRVACSNDGADKKAPQSLHIHIGEIEVPGFPSS